MKRSSNIELLRIVAMLMIVASHWGWAIYDLPAENFTRINDIFRCLFRSFGQVGVVIFVVISGYFSATKRFDIRSILRLLIEIFFMKIATLGIALIFSHYIDNFTFVLNTQSLLSVFMLISDRYWFVKVYIFVALLSPFINVILSKINKKQFTALLGIMFLFISVMPTLLQFDNENNFALFVFLYLLGAYMRIYPECINIKMGTVIIMTTVLYLLYCLSTLSSRLLWAQGNYNILLIITCLATFVLFLKMNIPQSKAINRIASTTFGVYILHETWYNFALWEDLLRCHEHTKNVLYPFYSIGCVILVFAVCSLISMSYKILLSPPLTKFVDNHFANRLAYINSLFPDIKNEIRESDEKSQNALPVVIQILVTYLISTCCFKEIYMYLSFLFMNIAVFVAVYLLKKKLRDNRL